MEWKLSINKEWTHLEQAFDWVADMRHVPQDPVHHGEGNVAIHTQKVLEALTSLDGYQQLTPQKQEVLWTAALLHDVEKRSTTVEEADGRISSRGHARRGEFTARRILFEQVPAPFAIREEIAALVRYHGLPLWAMDRQNPAKAVIEASLRVDLRLLSLLARADALGRICADQNDLLERIAFFEALCDEQQCWSAPRKFPSDLARFTYFHKEESYPDYEPFDDLKGTVVMVAGLPGMGKDTYLRKFYPGLPVVSLDNIRREHNLAPSDTAATGWVVQAAKEQAKIYLRKGESFAWNATNITRQMRTQWIDLFSTYKARVKLVYVEVPYDTWLQQNDVRDYPVARVVLSRLLDKLEVPGAEEAHEVVFHDVNGHPASGGAHRKKKPSLA
jgi:predicted kinase